MRHVRNSSTLESYLTIRRNFWIRLPHRGYAATFLLPTFNTVLYAHRNKWLHRKPAGISHKRPLIFRSHFNFSHLHIKHVIKKHLPDVECIVSYRRTYTLKNITSA